MKPNNPALCGTQQIPVISYDERRAADAYQAHVALIDQERRYPSLKGNPAWQVLRDDALENFTLAFGGGQ
jgi:hypothetical protein